MIERTEDVAFLKGIAAHPAIWPWMSEEGMSPVEYGPLIHPMVHYLRFGDRGFFAFRMMNCVMYDSHVAMLPHTRADEAAKAAIQWMWRNTPAEKLVAYLPMDNRHAIRFAKRAGYREEGRLSAAFRGRGALLDLIVLGVSKCQTLQGV